MWVRISDQRGKEGVAGRGARGSFHFGQKRREIGFKIGERERREGRRKPVRRERKRKG